MPELGAADIATAYRRVTTGDENPPRPWAYLSHIGIEKVSDLAYLNVAGFTDQAGFDIVSNGVTYRVMVTRKGTAHG